MHFSTEVKIKDKIFLPQFKVKEIGSIVLYSDPKNILESSKGFEVLYYLSFAWTVFSALENLKGYNFSTSSTITFYNGDQEDTKNNQE